MPKVLKYDKSEEIWSDICDTLTFNTLRLMQNSCHFADNSFKCILLNKNNSRINQISLKFVPCGLTDNKPVLVLIMTWCWMGDMLLSVIWTNDAFDYWHIYASLDLNKLNIPCYCHLLIEAHFNQGPSMPRVNIDTSINPLAPEGCGCDAKCVYWLIFCTFPV